MWEDVEMTTSMGWYLGGCLSVEESMCGCRMHVQEAGNKCTREEAESCDMSNWAVAGGEYGCGGGSGSVVVVVVVAVAVDALCT
jgi:hypothetical protein